MAVRTESEVRAMLSKVESHLTGDEDSEDSIEVIRETLLWTLGERQDSDITDFLPVDEGSLNGVA